MKKKKRFRAVHFIFLLFLLVGVGCIILGVVLTVPQFKESRLYGDILENGSVTTGEVVDFKSGGVTVNDVDYYELTFTYEVGGEVRVATTPAYYTMTDVLQYMNGDREVVVRYTDEGALIEGFDASNMNKAPKMMLLFTCLFGVVFGTVGAVPLVKNARYVSVEKDGLSGQGFVEGTHSSMTVNGRTSYSLKVSFNNARGESVNGYTECDYSSRTASLAAGRTVNIKYRGKKVVITDDIDSLMPDFPHENPAPPEVYGDEEHRAPDAPMFYEGKEPPTDEEK